MTEPPVEEHTEVNSVKLGPGLIMLDTGCRKACGGRLWHKAIRHELDHRDIRCEYQVVENYQFGPGNVVVAEKLRTYLVGIGGVASTLSISELAPTPRLIWSGRTRRRHGT